MLYQIFINFNGGTVKNTIYQSLGAMLYVLATKKGASSKYLNWLKDETETIFVQMATKAGGLDYTNDDILRYLKENYNVDFDESAFGEAWDDLREKNRR